MIIGRKQNKRNVMKKVAIGTAVAGAAGYVAGILTAPKSGKETRASIKSGVDKELAKLHLDIDKTVGEAKKASQKASTKAKKELAELADKAMAAKDKTVAVASAVRRGESSDQDLAKALKQAQNALSNLRKYLKK